MPCWICTFLAFCLTRVSIFDIVLSSCLNLAFLLQPLTQIHREDLFITSKLWNTFHRPDLVIPALKETLANLSTPYVDLYLIHWPFAYKEGGEIFPKDENDKILFSDVDFVDTWKVMEEAVDAGLVKSIGISNFNAGQVKRVLEVARIKPVVNQIECHPYLTQQKLTEFLKSVDIAVTAYSPLGKVLSSKLEIFRIRFLEIIVCAVLS